MLKGQQGQPGREGWQERGKDLKLPMPMSLPRRSAKGKDVAGNRTMGGGTTTWRFRSCWALIHIEGSLSASLGRRISRG